MVVPILSRPWCSTVCFTADLLLYPLSCLVRDFLDKSSFVDLDKADFTGSPPLRGSSEHRCLRAPASSALSTLGARQDSVILAFSTQGTREDSALSAVGTLWPILEPFRLLLYYGGPY